MFRKAKVCDKVWDITNGWGEITRIYSHPNCLIIARFGNGDNLHDRTYTYGGYYTAEDTNPSLFWQEFEIPEKSFQKPPPQLKLDTKVIVWDNEYPNEGFKMYFSHFNCKYKICTFKDGRTSFSKRNDEDYISWDNWELLD